MNAARQAQGGQGDEPAVTKHQQTLDLGPGMTLTDTPGMMWPKIDHDADGYMLAASHAIGRNAVIDEEWRPPRRDPVARYPDRLAVRYRLDRRRDGRAGRSGAGRGGGPAARLPGQGRRAGPEKAAQILLQDYRDGALGRISLETPETRAHDRRRAGGCGSGCRRGATGEEAAGAAGERARPMRPGAMAAIRRRRHDLGSTRNHCPETLRGPRSEPCQGLPGRRRAPLGGMQFDGAAVSATRRHPPQRLQVGQRRSSATGGAGGGHRSAPGVRWAIIRRGGLRCGRRLITTRACVTIASERPAIRRFAALAPCRRSPAGLISS